ncbi:hypothetical protein B566_EDAN009191 [Ephemera danica]|nr:hypothetical protein B566_EDAN009191 [Ephemera danica]
MMSPALRLASALLLLAVVAHAQFGFPGQHQDPFEMLRRLQRAARPKGQFSSASSSASSSSSSGGAPIFFGNQGFGFPGQGAGFGFPSGNQGFHGGDQGYYEEFGDQNNGGHLGVRFGALPGGGSVQASSSHHSSGNRPGGSSSGSFVSSSSSTDGDGKIHYRVQSGRF